MTDEHAVQELARSAIGEFGHVDAWVNTAAVQSFGKFWEVPTRTMRRVVDVILVGSPVHVQRYWRELLGKLRSGELDPTFALTHRMRLDQAEEAYRLMDGRRDGALKVVLRP